MKYRFILILLAGIIGSGLISAQYGWYRSQKVNEQGYQLRSGPTFFDQTCGIKNIVDDSRQIAAYNILAKLAKLEHNTLIGGDQIPVQIQRKNSRRNTLVFFVLFLGALMLVIYKLLNQSKKRRIIELKLKQQQMENLLLQNKILGLSSIVEEQVSERIRLAKALHNRLGDLLSSVSRQFQRVQGEINKPTGINLVADTEKLMQNTWEELARISNEMIPKALINLDLKEAIMDLAEQIERDYDIQLDSHLDDQLELTEAQTINLYRIIQELINNTIKHAEADQITLSIHEKEHMMHVVVADNGLGFKMDLDSDGNGRGISNIIARVDFLRGTLVFDSTNGSRYAITFPMT